jgi:hypothetical protein
MVAHYHTTADTHNLDSVGRTWYDAPMSPLPWIQVHCDIRRHRKTQALEDALSDPLAWAYVVGLLLWTAETHPTGELFGVPAHRIATGAGYRGDAASFVNALRSCGFLDQDDRVHDWHEYQRARHDRAIRQREQAAERQRRHRAGAGHVSVTRDSDVTSRVTLSLSSNSSNYNSGNCTGRANLGELPENPWSADAALLRAHLRAVSPEEALGWPDPSGGPGTLRSALSARYSAWDGRDGRPTIDERAAATWDSLRKRLSGAYCEPLRAITAWTQWIGDGHDRALATMRRSSPQAPDPSSLASDLRLRKRDL